MHACISKSVFSAAEDTFVALHCVPDMHTSVKTARRLYVETIFFFFIRDKHSSYCLNWYTGLSSVQLSQRETDKNIVNLLKGTFLQGHTVYCHFKSICTSRKLRFSHLLTQRSWEDDSNTAEGSLLSYTNDFTRLTCIFGVHIILDLYLYRASWTSCNKLPTFNIQRSRPSWASSRHISLSYHAMLGPCGDYIYSVLP